jgi:hypothetical protein
MMARSDLLHPKGRIQKRKTNQSVLKIATRGRSIQMGHVWTAPRQLSPRSEQTVRPVIGGSSGSLAQVKSRFLRVLVLDNRVLVDKSIRGGTTQCLR